MLTRISCIGLTAALLTGCAAQQMNFANDKAAFSFDKAGCVLKNAQFIDKSGRGNAFPMVRFIAVGDGGVTIGQWTATCMAVSPNGASNCTITGGEGINFANTGGIGCPGLNDFRIVSSP